jgi:hypothetical protein
MNGVAGLSASGFRASSGLTPAPALRNQGAARACQAPPRNRRAGDSFRGPGRHVRRAVADPPGGPAASADTPVDAGHKASVRAYALRLERA